jgi:type IV pilus assembly protein PilA
MKNEKNLGVSVQVWHASCYKQWRVCKEKGSNKRNVVTKQKLEEKRTMKNEQGFSLIELLIVVAIIAIIAAIAVPNLLTARMAANETACIANLRSFSSAETSFSIENGQRFGTMAQLTTAAIPYLDNRWVTGATFGGYTYVENNMGTAAPTTPALPAAMTTVGTAGTGYSVGATAVNARYDYGIAADGVVRWGAAAAGYTLPTGVTAGNAVGSN